MARTDRGPSAEEVVATSTGMMCSAERIRAQNWTTGQPLLNWSEDDDDDDDDDGAQIYELLPKQATCPSSLWFAGLIM